MNVRKVIAGPKANACVFQVTIFTHSHYVTPVMDTGEINLHTFYAVHLICYVIPNFIYLDVYAAMQSLSLQSQNLGDSSVSDMET